MRNIKLKSHVGADGILHLDVPLDITNTELEITIMVKDINSTSKNTEEQEWSPGFFKKTAGAWQGEPLIREPQGDYDNREELF